MGVFQSTNAATPPSQSCVGTGCCTWNALSTGDIMPIDGCITALGIQTDSSGGVYRLRSIRIGNIADVISGNNGITYYCWHSATGENKLTQPKQGLPNYDINSESFSNNIVFSIGNAATDTILNPPSAGYALSGIRYSEATANFNIFGMLPLEIKWVNLNNLTQTEWIPAVSGQVSITDSRLCSKGLTQYAGAVNDRKLIQKFSVNWGGKSGDGLFNIFNVVTLDVKAVNDYALATPTPLLRSTPGEKYGMYLGSLFDKLRDSFYRNRLVGYWCQASKEKSPNKVMDPVCWCKFPAEAVLTPQNNIYIDRKVAESKTQQGLYSGAPPKCYLNDCKNAYTGPEQQNATYLFTNPDSGAPCPDLPPINICAVSIDIWQSENVEVAIQKLEQTCNFTNNNPPPQCLLPENKNNPICKAFLPPGPTVDCKDAKNRNTPECIAYCKDPVNKNKPECVPVPGPVVDCTNPANRNTPQCIAYCNDPANRNRPECKAPVVDCTDPANRNRPECQPTPTPEVDCTLESNKALAVCFCKDTANRNTDTCNTYCNLEENKNKTECAPLSFWAKYKAWIIGIIIVIIVIMIGVAIARSRRKNKQEAEPARQTITRATT